ncbi:MAG: hypothetical protein M3P23_05365 [Actinomycetota bacterium]|nr:hypothetical protein [Actinomycetota bacterium]
MRGWRSTWLVAGAGLALLTGLVLALKTALTAIPINALRLVVGALLLVFGLQWLCKGIRRVSANGFRGMGDRSATADGIPVNGVDWTAFVLSFKGVLLEGLEITFIVVSFGITAQALPSAVLGAVAAFVVIAGAGVLASGLVAGIPRSALQLVVGTLLTSFGTFWAVEGLGVRWPGGDGAIPVLAGWYALAAVGYVWLLRREAVSLATPEVTR